MAKISRKSAKTARKLPWNKPRLVDAWSTLPRATKPAKVIRTPVTIPPVDWR